MLIYFSKKDQQVLNSKSNQFIFYLMKLFCSQNEHQEQCSSIPNEVDNALDGIHMEPCYKKFTIIIFKARNKRKTSNDPEDDDALRKKSRAQRTSVGGNFFPDHCYFCKKKRKSVKGKVQFSHNIS